MRKLIYLSILGILVTSCFNPKKGEVEVDITTFKGPVKFSNLCENRISKKTEIEGFVQSMATSVKYQCKNQATYKPLDANFFTAPKLGDTIKVILTGTAENSYGVPGEITGYGNIVKGKLLDSVHVYSH
jgi:hypothetical protein